WWLRMRKIVFPVVAPGVFAGGLLAFVTALGEFVSSVMLWIPSNRPISVAIFSELDEFNLGTAAAYGVLLILLIGAALLGSQRFLGLKTRGVIG
ncbi:MAG: iron ABC transporter permease, partial [Candidatus Latescibacteria bacterium]|nr:iron ABC transporter permease [Candidatus Latescibacterota bacterium]